VKKIWKLFLIIGFIIIILSGLVFIINSISTAYTINNKKNEIAAIVNGEKIYINDIERIYNDLKEHESSSSGNAVGPIPNKKEILDDIINELLVIQEAEKQNIVVNDEEVENRINILKEQMPELYETVLKKVSLEEYKKILKNGMLYQKMRENVLKENPVYVSEEEVLTYIEKNKEDFYKNNINEDKFDEIKNIVKEEFKEREEIKVFNQWIEKIKNKAEIKIFFNF